MPGPSSDYELGRSYRTSLRQVAEPEAKTRQAVLLDLLGDDRTLLAPLRHLVESPNFHDSINEPSEAVRHARRVTLLDELGSWCNQEALRRIEAFLSGAFDFPCSRETSYSKDAESSESPAENSDNSADSSSFADLEQTTASSQSSTASSARDFSDGKSTEKAISELSAKAHSASLNGEHQRSIDLLTEALRIDPAKADLYMQRASLHAKNQDAGSAIQDFTSVLSLEPNNYEARAQRGQAYALMGSSEAAIGDWEKASASGHLQAMQWLSSKLLDDAKDMLASGRYHEAIRSLSQAIKLTPNNAELYYIRGKVNQVIPYHGLAISDFSTAIRLDPAHASAHALRGKSYQHAGKISSALSDWKTAVHLGHSEAWKWRVEAERLNANSSTSGSSTTKVKPDLRPNTQSASSTYDPNPLLFRLLAVLAIPGLLVLIFQNAPTQTNTSSSNEASVGGREAASELFHKVQLKSRQAVLACEHQEVIGLLDQVNLSELDSGQIAERERLMGLSRKSVKQLDSPGKQSYWEDCAMGIGFQPYDDYKWNDGGDYTGFLFAAVSQKCQAPAIQVSAFTDSGLSKKIFSNWISVPSAPATGKATKIPFVIPAAYLPSQGSIWLNYQVRCSR